MSPLPSSSIRRSIGRPRLGGKTGTVPSVYPAGGPGRPRGRVPGHPGRRAAQRSRNRATPATSSRTETTSIGDGPAGGAVAPLPNVPAEKLLSGGAAAGDGDALSRPKPSAVGAPDGPGPATVDTCGVGADTGIETAAVDGPGADATAEAAEAAGEAAKSCFVPCW